MTARRVVLVVDGLGISGKTKAMADLACGLDATRYRATVICANTENSPLLGQLGQAGVEVRQVPVGDGLRPGNLARLAANLYRLRPHVVHAYNPRAMLNAGVAAHLLGVFATVGSLSAFACHVPDRSYEFLPQPLMSTTRRNRIRNRALIRLMRRLAVVSRSLGQRFCRWNGIDEKKLREVAYGVPVPLCAPLTDARRADLRNEMGAGREDILVGSVGRLVEQKDYPTQLEAFARAVRDEPRLRMVLVGEGPLRGEITRQAAALGIAERLVLLGHRVDVPQLMSAMDIFVMTSKFEPYGVALLEAKAAGLAIVATGVGEVPEILSGGESGVLSPARNAEALGQALLALARDPARRVALSTQALREAHTRHSLRAMIAGYQDLYDEVLG